MGVPLRKHSYPCGVTRDASHPSLFEDPVTTPPPVGRCPHQGERSRPEGAAAAGSGAGLGLVCPLGFSSCSLTHTDYGGDSSPFLLSKRSDGVLPDYLYVAPLTRRKKQAPPPNRGYSERLSAKGARGIQAACLIASQAGTPMRAMLTVTVADEHLSRFLPPDGFDGYGKPELYLSREIRRLMNALRERCRRRGIPLPVYVWVAEAASSGKRAWHPAVHILLSLTVAYAEFAEWAAWFEAEWGFGWAHYEKLRNLQYSSRYLLKAARYVAKGAHGEQGRIWGRRFGVSAGLRHHEARSDVTDSEAAAFAVLEVASALRRAGRSVVKVPYGVFSRYGFTPTTGAGAAQVVIASSVALGLLGGTGDEPF